MSYQVPTTQMPAMLVVGDYWQWRYPAHGDYPAATWTLTFALIGPATLSVGTGWTIAAEAGGTWLVQVAKATTAGYTAGRYQWRAYVTNGSERYQLAAGWIVLDANAAVLTSDQRTHAQKMLAYIDAALEARANGDVFAESYSIGGRSIAKMSTRDLRSLRGTYLAEVYRETHPDTAGVRSVGVGFLPPGAA